MTKEKAVVLLSGGIDSATCMGIACSEHDDVLPVHVRYGQQTEELEREMAARQRNHMSMVHEECYVHPLEVIDYTDVFSHFADGVADPDKEFDHLTEEDGRSAGYVPVRNLHLISTGAAIADTNNCQFVYHGAQGGDAADYPDCRPEFMDKAAGAIAKSVPDDQSLELRAPVISKSKPEVIQKADEVHVDFEFTYSCYEKTIPEEPDPCGQCPACVERGEAFEEAGIEDPHGTEMAR